MERIVPADRLDGVANKLDPNRIVRTGGKIIDDAAANAELAVLVDGILAREAGVGEQVAERDRIEIHPVLELDGRGFEIAGRAEPRQERGRRGHDDRARVRSRCACSARGARRGDTEMGRDVAVRVDLQGRERLDGILERGGRGAFERGHEESGVDAELIDVLVARHDDDDTALLRWLDCAATYKRLRGRRQARGRATRSESMPVRAAAVLRSACKVERSRGRHT